MKELNISALVSFNLILLDPASVDFREEKLYGRGSTASRLQSHYEETVYFLPLFTTNLTHRSNLAPWCGRYHHCVTFFICYLAAPRPTLSHCCDDSLVRFESNFDQKVTGNLLFQRDKNLGFVIVHAGNMAQRWSKMSQNQFIITTTIPIVTEHRKTKPLLHQRPNVIKLKMGSF